MSRTRFSRLLGSLIVLAVAIAAYLAAPPAPRAESAEDPECNLGNTGIVCGVRTECVRVWRVFYSCTMEYLRRPLGSGVDPHIEDRSPEWNEPRGPRPSPACESARSEEHSSQTKGG